MVAVSDLTILYQHDSNFSGTSPIVGRHAGGFKVEDGVGGHGVTLDFEVSLRERAATGSLYAHHAEGGTSLADPLLFRVLRGLFGYSIFNMADLLIVIYTVVQFSQNSRT